MSARVESASAPRILFVKLCCIGDVLFMTPTVRAVRKRFPRAHVAFLVGSWTREVAEAIPQVDEVLVMDPPGHLPARRWPQILRTFRVLRRRRFQMAIIGHRTPWAGFMAKAAGIPRRVGFDDGGRGWNLTDRVPFDPHLHEIRRYLRLLEPLGAEPQGVETEVSVDPEAMARVDGWLRAWKIPEGSFLVGIQAGGGVNPGLTMPTKRWPGYGDLIRRLVSELDARVVLVGGASDRSLAEQLLASAPPGVVSAVGRTTWRDLAALLRRCHLVIGNDSGPLHLAAAVGTPTLGIFGPSDPRLVAPLGEMHRYAWHPPSCAPCYNPRSVMERRTFPCPTGVTCMTALSVETVWSLVLEQYARLRRMPGRRCSAGGPQGGTA